MHNLFWTALTFTLLFRAACGPIFLLQLPSENVGGTVKTAVEKYSH